MLKILNKRERIILYTTIGVIFFSIGFNFLVAPILVKNENLNKEINITRAKLGKYMLLLSQKKYIQEKYSKFSEPLRASSLKEETPVNILSELENLAQTSNIRIIDIRPQTQRSAALYSEVIIDLRAEGTMEGFLKFIYNLENSLSLLRIKRMQINAKINTSTLEGSFSISKPSVLE